MTAVTPPLLSPFVLFSSALFFPHPDPCRCPPSWNFVDQVVSNIHLRLWCDAQLAVFSNSFMWLTAVLPYLVVAERYFAGEIEFGVISQVKREEGGSRGVEKRTGATSIYGVPRLFVVPRILPRPKWRGQPRADRRFTRFAGGGVA